MSTLTVTPLPALQPRSRFGVIAWVCSVFLVVIVVGALLAPMLAPYAPDEIDFDNIWSSPNAAHWLGTDQLGRDLLSRALFGARDSLLGPVLLLLLATVAGLAIGTLAAWKGGWVDTLLARITDVMFAFPGILFVVLVIAVLGQGAATTIVALALAYTPVIAKYTRSLVLAEMVRPYVDAYRLQGVSPTSIAVRFVVPNIAPSMVGYLVVLFGDALMSLATLSYLGFGSQPPSSEWGLMVQEGQSAVIQGYFWPVFVPGALIALVVVAVNVVGVKISDRMNARMR
ncbi:MAG: ABC transporter permease [Arthrobacter sp.]|jgi:peptide/nickel transport system permease protein|nr:ABC transporter permease [Arthrobacter sp.]